jgi:hypothetical protein
MSLVRAAMPLPEPEPGRVIRYNYLWAEEQEQGREEGRKDRPCVIVVAARRVEDRMMVTVVPITRSPQAHDSIELPPAIKAQLGLDPGDRSWVVCSEYNEFEWPGPDLRPVPRTGAWDYGRLPARFFLQVLETLRTAARRRQVWPVPRPS